MPRPTWLLACLLPALARADEPAPCAQAPLAARLDALAAQKDYDALAVAVERALACGPSDWKVGYRASLERVAADLGLRRCDARLEGKDGSDDAAACYWHWIAEHPRSPDLPRARRNRSHALRRVGHDEEAVAELRALTTAGPDYAPEAWFQISLYEQQHGRLAAAAAASESLVRDWPKDRRFTDALHNAALLRLQLGDCAAASAHARRLRKTQRPDSADARAANQVLAQCAEAQPRR